MRGSSTSTGGAVAGFGGAARLLIVKVGDGTTVSDVDVAAGIVRSVQSGARILNVSLAGRTRSAVEADAVAPAPARCTRRRSSRQRRARRQSGRVPRRTAPAGRLQRRRRARPRRCSLRHGRTEGDLLGARVVHRARSAGHHSLRCARFDGEGIALRARSASRRPGSLRVRKRHLVRSPQVAGAAALVWAANPRLTARQVAAVLEQTASGHGSWSAELGYGVIDVAAAVDLALRLAS